MDIRREVIYRYNKYLPIDKCAAMAGSNSANSSSSSNDEPSVSCTAVYKPSEKALKRSRSTTINDFFDKKRGRKRHFANKTKKARLRDGNNYVAEESVNDKVNAYVAILLKLDANSGWSICQLKGVSDDSNGTSLNQSEDTSSDVISTQIIDLTSDVITPQIIDLATDLSGLKLGESNISHCRKNRITWSNPSYFPVLVAASKVREVTTDGRIVQTLH